MATRDEHPDGRMRQPHTSEQRLRQLPTAHAVALRLRDQGLDDDAIANALGMDPDAVPTLIDIARAKLSSTEGDSSPT